MRLFLIQFRRDAGEAGDAIEKLLLDQLAFSHFKIGRLHALAEAATEFEHKKVYTNAAARLLSETCKTVETLIAYRNSLRKRLKKKVRLQESKPERAEKKTGAEEAKRPPVKKKKSQHRSGK